MMEERTTTEDTKPYTLKYGARSNMSAARLCECAFRSMLVAMYNVYNYNLITMYKLNHYYVQHDLAGQCIIIAGI